MWHILDNNKKAIGVIDNAIPKGLPLLTDNHHELLEYGYSTLEFTVPLNHEKVDNLDEEYFIVYYDEDTDKWRLFRIKELEEDTDSMTMSVFCETSATSDLLGTFVRPVSWVSEPLSRIAKTVLGGSGWSLGETFYDALVTLSIDDYPTTLEALKTISEQFGAELEFEVVMKGSKVAAQLVHFREQRGEETGEIFEVGRNLKGVKRKRDSNKIYTAMIGVSSNEDANGRKISIVDAKVTPPSPFVIVDDYVGDLDALERYGNGGQHVFGVFSDDTATNPVELYNNTLAELKKWNKPQYTYEVDAILLDGRKNIGDTVVVKDTRFPTPLYLNARVLEKEKSTIDPTQDKVVLGEYVLLKVEPITSIMKLQKLIQLKEAMWNKAIQKAKDSLKNVSSTQKDSGIHKDAQPPTFTRNSTITYRGFSYGVNVPVYDYGGIRIDTTIGEALTVPTANVLYAEEGTIEARVTVLDLENYNNIFRMDYNASNRFLLFLNTDGRVAFSIDAWGGDYVRTDVGAIAQKKPFDVALRWSNKSKTYSLFVNKKLIGTKKYDKATYGEFPSILKVVDNFSAVVGNLRISKVARTDKELTGA